MELIPTTLPGCYVIQCRITEDRRGRFVETYQKAEFDRQGLRTDWLLQYYSVSAAGVLRGMHFQTPPAEHAKLVHCLAGEAVDVVVDLRRGSPSFGECAALRLSPEGGQGVYVPPGLAHGFLATTDHTIMHYAVTGGYSPAHDAGVLWSSLPFDWPVEDPILSDRDMRHPRLEDFRSPFSYQASGGGASQGSDEGGPQDTGEVGPRARDEAISP